MDGKKPKPSVVKSARSHSSPISSLQAAQYLGCSEQTLRISRHTGKLFGVTAPPYRKLGRTVRYERARLDEWLGQFEEQTNTGGAA